MVKACLALAFFCLGAALQVEAFTWDTATSNGREYVTLQSFCTFYSFGYQDPGGNATFDTHNAQHTLRLKGGSPDMYLDGVHYVMSFPVERGDHDWLVSRMDVIKLFEPIVRPTEISDRHVIRGVVIDAGHGGTDNGAVSARGGMEKRYTLDTAFRLEAILHQLGLKTVLTRRSDFFVDLYERAHIASLYPDYAFVSIHFNSATPEARGLETYCLSPRGAASTSSNYLTRSDIQKLPGNDFDASNVLLASMVHSEIIKLNPGDQSMDRGVKRARFVVIKQNVLPAILVEGGFVSNRMEAARVNTDQYHQDLANAIARGIVRFINVMGDKKLPLPGGGSVAPPPVNPPPPPEIAPAPSGLARDSAEVPGDRPTIAPTANPKAIPIVPKVLPLTTTSGPAGGSAATAGPGASLTSSNAHKKSKDKKKSAAPVVSQPAPSTTEAVKRDIQAAETNPPTATAPATTTPETTPPSVPMSPEAPEPSASAPASTGNDSSDKTAPKTSAPLNLTEPAPPPPSAVSDKAAAEPDEPPTVNIYSTAPKAASGTKPASDTSSTNNAPSGPNPQNP